MIEIIAVLVILGILATVATPRFINLQEEARIKALDGAVAAAQSAVSMEYERQILINNGDEDAAWTVGIEALDARGLMQMLHQTDLTLWRLMPGPLMF